MLQVPGSAPEQLNDRLLIGKDGYLFVKASGGKGGNGGRGGDGGPGSQGYAGRNATRYSRGTNGGPGGDGGDAGQPSDGRYGGDGGLVDMTVDHQDLGLLMLVKGNLAAGDVGFAGEAARGGHGGPGGIGGRSFSWPETRTYRNSKGQTQSRTVWRTNPGGINGPRGRDGRSSRYRARDGQAAQPGKLRIKVRESDGQLSYHPAPFDLELVTFDIASEYSILEPDSLVSVDRIVVRNCGGMRTPENYTIRIFLQRDDWLVSEEVDLIMHQSLQPGQTYTFTDHGLRLRIGDYVVDQPRSRSFRLRHPVNPQARMESGIGRPFRRFEKGEDIRVRFPVEIQALTCLNSLAPGESTRVICAIRNVGQETFAQKYLYRACQSKLRLLGGDLDPKLVRFFDDLDKNHSLLDSEFAKPIAQLKPGESAIFETRIGIVESAAAVPYQGFALAIDLDLQRPGSSFESSDYRCVDSRKAFVRVSERYLREPDSRFLLIANERTTTADIEKWTGLADYFGSSLDVWDVSYYGFLDLVRAVDEDESLLDQWKGMTVIVPNNYYSTPNGRTVAFAQLAKGQFLRAAADHDINFYIVGDSRTGGAEMLTAALVPVDDQCSPSNLKSQKEFLKSVKRWNKYVARSQDVVGGVTSGAADLADASLGAFHHFDIDKRTFLFQPKPEWLEAEARRLQRKLAAQDPLHRWIVVHRYDTEETDTSWGFFRKRDVGKLELRRSLDATKGSVVLYEVDGIDAIDQDFINSESNKHGILLSLKFEDKVDRLIRLVSERTFPRFSEKFIDRPMTDEEVRQIGTELVDSILTDLYNEQLNARNCRTWGRGGVRAIMPHLNYLAERSLNYGVTYRQMMENEASLSLLYDLLANLRYMAWKSKTVWDLAVFPTSFFKRSRAVSRYMDNRTDQIITNIFGSAPGWWDRMTSAGDDYDPFGSAKKKAPQGIERQTADQQIGERNVKLRRSQKPVSEYSAAQDHKGLTYDPELLVESVRVMSGEQYDRLVAQEKRAARRRQETEQMIAAERSDLLVPLKQASVVTQTQEVALQMTS